MERQSVPLGRTRYACRTHGSHLVLRELIEVIRSWRWVGFELTDKGRSRRRKAA